MNTIRLLQDCSMKFIMSALFCTMLSCPQAMGQFVMNTPPEVKLTSPAQDSVFAYPANITLIAQANDVDGYDTVQTVEFFASGKSLGIKTNEPVLNPIGPFYLTWTNPAWGEYLFTAKAVDEGGLSSVSQAVRIQVLPPENANVLLIDIKADEIYAEENAGPNNEHNKATFVIQRTYGLQVDPPFTNDLMLRYTVSGQASNGVDFVALSGSVTIPAGTNQAQIVVEPIDDNLLEGTENLIVTLDPHVQSTGPLPYYLIRNNTATVYIIDDETQPPVITLQTIESNAWERPIYFNSAYPGRVQVNRQGDLGYPLEIHYAVSGTASNGVDYAPLPGFITLPRMASNAVIYILPWWEGVTEGQEMVVITVTPCPPGTTLAEYYTLGDRHESTVFINDYEPPWTNKPVVTISAADGDAYEPLVMYDPMSVPTVLMPDQGAFEVKRSFATGQPLEVRVKMGGTASNGLDYAAITSPVVIPAGQLSTTVHVIPKYDDLEETDETVTMVALSDTNYLVSSTIPAVVTIHDATNPLPPEVTVEAVDTEAAETPPWLDVVPNMARFTFFRKGYTNVALNVSYTVGGTASNGIDYHKLSGLIEIPAGTMSVSVDVDPIYDGLYENTETVVIQIEPPICPAIWPAPLWCYRLGTPNKAEAIIKDYTAPTRPTVEITSPLAGTIFDQGSDITIKATTVDLDGYASRIELYANNEKIGEQQIVFIKAPTPGMPIHFEYVWKSPPVGVYNLTAKTWDNQGLEAVSAPVQITVEPVITDRRELHVVGVYSGCGESSTGTHHPEGTVDVVVNRPGQRVTLCLSSYEPEHWQIMATGETMIQKVILCGYYPQRVSGVASNVEIVETFHADNPSGGFLYLGYSVDSLEFYQGLPRLEAMTGLKVASFHGAVQASWTLPFVIAEIQNDPRLSSEYPQPVSADQLPDLNFTATFYDGYSPGAGNIATRAYTLAGPKTGDILLPGMRLVGGSDSQYLYGTRSQEVYRVNIQTEMAETMKLGSSVPPLSWPMGVGYDSKRHRVLLASLGGEGFLYAYDTLSKLWSLVSSLNNKDLDSLVYHEADDCVYGVEVCHGVHPTLLKYDARGSYLGEIKLPVIPMGIGPGGYQSELVSVGQYLVLMVEPEHHAWTDQNRWESRMYLINPQNSDVWLTFRKIHVPNAVPNVEIVSPANNTTFTAPVNVTIQAVTRDIDGYASRAEFYGDGVKLGERQIYFFVPLKPGEAIQMQFVWTNVPVGTHSLMVKAYDDQGAAGYSSPVNIIVNDSQIGHQMVTVSAKDAYASEERHHGNNNASFIIRRSGNKKDNLTVYFKLTGTAMNGIDYEYVPSSVIIEAGERSATVKIKPLDDALEEGVETVLLTLCEPPGEPDTYRIGNKNRAAVIVTDKDWWRPHGQVLPDKMMHLSLPGTEGMHYRLETSADLKTWTVIDEDLLPSNGMVEYIDPDAMGESQRFYRIIPTHSSNSETP